MRLKTFVNVFTTLHLTSLAALVQRLPKGRRPLGADVLRGDQLRKVAEPQVAAGGGQLGGRECRGGAHPLLNMRRLGGLDRLIDREEIGTQLATALTGPCDAPPSSVPYQTYRHTLRKNGGVRAWQSSGGAIGGAGSSPAATSGAYRSSHTERTCAHGMWRVHVVCARVCGVWHVACGMWHVACAFACAC